MILELIAVSLSCLIMTLYLSAYITTIGVPTSISATYYKTERKWLFPAAISLTGICALVPLLGKIHATAASVLGLCAVIWLLAIGDCPWIAMLGVCVAVLDYKHFLFWIEVGLLYNLFISLMTVVVMNG